MAFRSDDRGSAAIDWVALAAGVVLLGVLTVFAVFRVGVDDVTTAIDEAMAEADCADQLGTSLPGASETPSQERDCVDPGPAPRIN